MNLSELYVDIDGDLMLYQGAIPNRYNDEIEYISVTVEGISCVLDSVDFLYYKYKRF